MKPFVTSQESQHTQQINISSCKKRGQQKQEISKERIKQWAEISPEFHYPKFSTSPHIKAFVTTTFLILITIETHT